MRTPLALTALALLFTILNAGAAPAPSREVKEKLDALKKRLPGVVTDAWAKTYFAHSPLVPVVRRVRAIGDAEAKVTIHMYVRWEGKLDPDPQRILFVFLEYHDSLWTTVRFEWSSAPPEAFAHHWNEAAYLLLDAIDEASEK